MNISNRAIAFLTSRMITILATANYLFLWPQNDVFFLITIGHQPEYLVRAAVEAAAATEEG